MIKKIINMIKYNENVNCKFAYKLSNIVDSIDGKIIYIN